MKQKDVLLNYLYNQSVILSDSVNQLQANLRFRNVMEYDCLEMIIAKSNLVLFTQMSSDIMIILKMGSFKE